MRSEDTPAPGAIQLRVPTPGGGIPGPILPLAGRTAATAQSGFGLNLGVWLDLLLLLTAATVLASAVAYLRAAARIWVAARAAR